MVDTMLYGLGGLGEAGKTTSAKIMSRILYHLGYMPKILSMADPLKREAAEAHGYAPDDWERFKRERPLDYRSYCIVWGAKRRAENEDYWVDRWEQRVKDTIAKKEDTKHPLFILVDDVRYRNEVDRIRHLGGVLGFVSAGSRLPNPKSDYRSGEAEALNTTVEATLQTRFWSPAKDPWKHSPYDHVILNTGTEQQLTTRLNDLMLMATSPIDIEFSANNPFVYAVMREYEVAYRTLTDTHLKEIHSAGLPDELIERYAPRAAKIGRPRR